MKTLMTEHEVEHPSRWAAISSIAAEIGCSAQFNIPKFSLKIT
jgi:hypothetical protein